MIPFFFFFGQGQRANHNVLYGTRDNLRPGICFFSTATTSGSKVRQSFIIDR